MAHQSAPRATVAVVSIGEMGLGIAKLLKAHNYKVITNVSDRRCVSSPTFIAHEDLSSAHISCEKLIALSQSTQKRAQAANLELVSSDTEIASQVDYILSIVPPRDARATARRFISVFSNASRTSQAPMYYLDLNAISPSTSKSIASEFEPLGSHVRYLDGGIIGGPPKPKEQQGVNGPNPSSAAQAEESDPGSSWTRPSIPLSGPHPLTDAAAAGSHLATLLNSKHISPSIGVASGLKCCFASLTKGFTALAIQSYTTASALGVLPHLEEEIAKFSGDQQVERCRKSIVGMAPKAGRWVEEMREIGKAFGEEGGWEKESIFEGVAGVYELVSRGTVLGSEKVGERKRGAGYEDAVDAIREGLDGRTSKKRKEA
jgi:hypothetical protein